VKAELYIVTRTPYCTGAGINAVFPGGETLHEKDNLIPRKHSLVHQQADIRSDTILCIWQAAANTLTLRPRHRTTTPSGTQPCVRSHYGNHQVAGPGRDD
jgi:hypothetical protein